MNLHRSILSLVALLAVAIPGLSATEPVQNAANGSSRELKSEAVVDGIAMNSEAEKAGLQEGDVLLRWTRGESSGVIESPFDLSWVELEQAPRGMVRLEGLRGEERRAWTLGPSDWGIKTRPDLPEGLLSIYHDSQSLADAGKLDEAAKSLRTAASRDQGPDASRRDVWLIFRTAQLQANARQWKESDDAYQEALERARNMGPSAVLQLLKAWADAYRQRNNWANAQKYYQQSITEGDGLAGEELMVAASIHSMGATFYEQGDPASAEKYFRQALAIREKFAPASLPVTASLSGLGLTAWKRGDLAKAEEYYLQVLAIRQKLAPDSLDMGKTLTSLGVLAWKSGDLTKAENYYRQALSIQQKLAPEELVVAGTLNNVGIVAWEHGDLVSAENDLRHALAIEQKQAPNSPDIATMLLNLGNLARERDDFARAEEYYLQALTIQKDRNPNSIDVAMSLNNLGIVCWDLGRLAEAETYLNQALAIREKLAPGSLDVAESMVNLGSLAKKSGNLAKAQDYEQQALAIEQKLAPESLTAAGTLYNLADLAHGRGDMEKAELGYREALAIREKLAPGSVSHAESLASLAVIMREKHQLDAAAQLFAQAIDALETQTTHLGGEEEIRSDFRARHAEYYRDYLDLLLERKQPEAAFQMLERSRARTLLELLAEAHVDIRRGVDPGLLEQEQSLQRSLTAESGERLKILSDKHTEDQIASLDKEIEKLLRQYHEVEAQIREDSPAYAALTLPQPVSAREVQQQLLDADSLLLEYTLGEQRSYVWAVTQNSLETYELPKRSVIEELARRVYDLLTARNRKIKDETEFQKQARLARAEAEYPEAAAALSRMILAPVFIQLKKKRVLIVSDGALQYVPFGALPLPASSVSAEGKQTTQPLLSDSRPLAVQHEVINLPSASILAFLRRKPVDDRSLPETVVVFADPVFDANDDRLRVVSKDGKHGAVGTSELLLSHEAPGRFTREAGVSGGESFSRLPFTRREAEAIYSIAAPGTAKKVLDFDASKAAAIGSQLREYRIVHFATHGLINSEHPELSGLVFSLVDRQGKPQDGFVRLFDIYNLSLHADLVVLSACQTALGKQTQQEGLVGLTRGFMYAGADRVMASLWNVDDEATAELMQKFYEGVLKNGQTPAQALRSAQMWMYSQKTWNAPYYWAGFILQGEWK